MKFESKKNIQKYLLQVKINLNLNMLHANQIWGVTRDPKSKEYAIVTEFRDGGSLKGSD